MKIDSALIQSCIKDDRNAIHELYQYCYVRLMGIGMRYLKDKNNAVAAYHSSFIKILNGLPEYSDQQNFDAWVKRIMVNTCIDTFRKESKHHSREYPFDPADFFYKNSSVDWNLAESKLNTDEILKLVQALPERTRQVFNLYVMEDFKHLEIADMLDMSEGTSKWHLSKARSMLQQKLLKIMDQKSVNINVS